MAIALDPPRQAEAAELPEIAALLDTVFPHPHPWLPALEWQYLANPSGPAWYVNARDPGGSLIAHYAVVPSPALDAEPYASLRTFFSLNTAVHPHAQVPGLMVLTARKLFQHLQTLEPSIILGVANEKSYAGFTRLLGFRPLGRLALGGLAPFALPREGASRALKFDETVMKWRVARPGAQMFAAARDGAILRRMSTRGLPVDVVLSVGLPREAVARLSLPDAPRALLPAAPRLYATFPPGARAGFALPDRLRPSPLEYIFRLLAPGVDAEGVARYLSSRRFEFFDFDVV